MERFSTASHGTLCCLYYNIYSSLLTPAVYIMRLQAATQAVILFVVSVVIVMARLIQQSFMLLLIPRPLPSRSTRYYRASVTFTTVTTGGTWSSGSPSLQLCLVVGSVRCVSRTAVSAIRCRVVCFSKEYYC